MAKQYAPHKLGFPGMPDKEYQKNRERLIQADSAQKKSKNLSFKSVAGKLIPNWDDAR